MIRKDIYTYPYFLTKTFVFYQVLHFIGTVSNFSINMKVRISYINSQNILFIKFYDYILLLTILKSKYNSFLKYS